jgi:DNA-damage-inducible protein D
LPEIEKKKGIKKGELLDVSGSTELAANLFRITQTDEKIKKEGINSESVATQTHFMVGGKIRQTIKDIGGELPENIPTEKHIKEVKKEIKLSKNKEKKLK